jgi:hypothetical protein
MLFKGRKVPKGSLIMSRRIRRRRKYYRIMLR